MGIPNGDVVAIRNYEIMREYKNGVSSYGELAGMFDCSAETARSAIRRIKFIEPVGTLESYGRMLYDICAIILDHDGDPNKCLTITMTALWIAGITTPSKLSKLSHDKFEELLAGKCMKRAGEKAKEALWYYRYELKKTKKV